MGERHAKRCNGRKFKIEAFSLLWMKGCRVAHTWLDVGEKQPTYNKKLTRKPSEALSKPQPLTYLQPQKCTRCGDIRVIHRPSGLVYQEPETSSCR